MRVIAGTAKGRQLKVPPSGTRPTSGKMRESLFSKLESWGVVRDARVLDLFAGSGALAIEALSRGAREATLVDSSKHAVAIIKGNLEKCGLHARVQKTSALSFMPAGEYDLVFLDPPYVWEGEDWGNLLGRLQNHLAVDGVIVAERDRRSGVPPLPSGLEVEDERTFGDSTLFFLGLSG